MKTTPILFSTPMVKSILAGNKTQTRRTSGQGLKDINKNPENWKYIGYDGKYFNFESTVVPGITFGILPPYGVWNDILWVRETWFWDGQTKFTDIDPIGNFWYKADAPPEFSPKWKPSLFMPKEAARIFLEIEDISLERLNTISPKDAIAEGIEMKQMPLIGARFKNYVSNSPDARHVFNLPPTQSFCSLWQSINGLGSWNSNLWVWVIKFKRVKRPENL